MDIAVIVRNPREMSERFFYFFTRADFHLAAAEMLRLNLPGAEPVALSEAEYRSWSRQAAEGDVMIEGCVTAEGENIDCVAGMHWMKRTIEH